jgi:hypothetical protein
LSSVFGIQEVVRYPILEGFVTREASTSSELPHYPDRYEELRHGLHVPFKGAVFLVGAGPLGKVYCHWIRERGGIALDIGSLFDAWAGIASRQRIAKLFRYMTLDAYTEPTTEVERHARYREVLRNFGLASPPPLTNWSSCSAEWLRGPSAKRAHGPGHAREPSTSPSRESLTYRPLAIRSCNCSCVGICAA